MPIPGEQQRQHPEAADEMRQQSLRRQRGGHVLVESLDAVDRQILVERLDARGARAATSCAGGTLVRTCNDHVRFVGLRQRHVEHRAR